MADRLQRSSADSAQLLHAANELSQREARLCARRDAVTELEAALAVTLTQRNVLSSSLVSDEFFDALDAAHAVCRLDHYPPAMSISAPVADAHTLLLQALYRLFIFNTPQCSAGGAARL
jgi:hypothetical protein